MQVPNGTGPGVRRSKRPLLASRTRCNVLWKPPKFGNKVKIGIKVQFGNKFANRCNVWSIEGVIVYGYVPECHVTFGRGRLHNGWWDPLLVGKCINNRTRGRSGKGAELIVYCFRKRHLWGSKLHAGYSIPLRFYLGWSAFWGRCQKIRVGPYYIYYMTEGVAS